MQRRRHCGSTSTALCGAGWGPSWAAGLQSLCGRPHSLLQGLLLSLFLAPLHPPACQSPLQGVPAPWLAHLQAWLPNLLPIQRSPQWTPPHLPMLFFQGLPLTLDVEHRQLQPQPRPQPLLQASQPWASPHRPPWVHRLAPSQPLLSPKLQAPLAQPLSTVGKHEPGHT